MMQDEWKNGLVGGNGKTGVIWVGKENSDNFIFQNMDFIMPTPLPRHTPKEVGAELEEARQSIIQGDDSWDVHGRKRTYMYPFHPGANLELQYHTNFASISTKVDYQQNQLEGFSGQNSLCLNRKTFVSYQDDMVISHISLKNVFDVDLQIKDLSEFPKFGQWKHGVGPETELTYHKFADSQTGVIGLIAQYPSFEDSELKEAGYVVYSKILCKDGEMHLRWEDTKEEIRKGAHPVLSITGTKEFYIITKAVKVMQIQTEDVLSQIDKNLQESIDQYLNTEGDFSYEAALQKSVNRKQELFGEVSLQLSEGEDRLLTNVEVLAKQKNIKEMLPELVERAYRNGRYLLESCSSYAVPRLCGLWTGEYNPSWAGAYTMDANVNIQVSGMNTGNMYGTALGYIYFVLRQLQDWEENAFLVYGIHDAILTPVNTDGSRAVLVEYDKNYPFQYWNAGAAWMLAPIYEMWQCFGNKEIPLPEDLAEMYGKKSLDLAMDILRPLLRKVMNFWYGLCTPEYFVDVNGNPAYIQGKQELEAGEKYLIIPSYSPENIPLGYHSAITANATMDLSAARDCVEMVKGLEQRIMDEKSNQIRKACEDFVQKLPEYMEDETGALREWALEKYRDNHEHRHISHLYCAWPGYEVQDDDALRKACAQAIANREKANDGKDDDSSHGWIHRALVTARLKDSKSATDILRRIFTSNIFYNSLATDHDLTKGRGVFCTDTAIGLVGVIQEMLVYSDDSCIELFPVMISDWEKGSLRGIRTRNRILIHELTWNHKQGEAKVVLQAEEDRKIKIMKHGEESTSKEIYLKKGENRIIQW